MKRAFILLFFSSVLLAMEDEPLLGEPINYLSTSPVLEETFRNEQHWERLTDIPDEIINIIFAYVLSLDDDYETIINLSQTCRKFRPLLHNFMIFFPPKLSKLWTSEEFVGALSQLESLEMAFASQLKENPELRLSKNYIRGIKNIINAAPAIQYSYFYRKHHGKNRLESLKRIYQIEMEPTKRGQLRNFLSSIARDRRTLFGFFIGAVVISGMMAWPIAKDVFEFDNEFNKALKYADSDEFINTQMEYGVIKFLEPRCFFQCIKDFLWQCADLRGYCNNDPIDVAAFTNFTESLWRSLRNNCSFVQANNYTLDDVKTLFGNIVNDGCPASFFNRYSIERIGSRTSLLSQNINYFYCQGSSTFHQFNINAGSYDPRCVAKSMVSMSQFLPLWIVLGFSPYALILTIIVYGYCC